jgi:hypothetical protein
MTLKVDISRITACKLQTLYIQCSRKHVQLLQKKIMSRFLYFEKNANLRKMCIGLQL